MGSMRAASEVGGVARSLLNVGHLAVGGAALVFAVVLIVAGRDPNAELGGALVRPGVLLALAALAFIYAVVLVLRGASDGRAGSLSLILTVVELVIGCIMAGALVVAVQGYGAFEPWRSPLLLPSMALIVLGITGLWLAFENRTGA